MALAGSVLASCGDGGAGSAAPPFEPDPLEIVTPTEGEGVNGGIVQLRVQYVPVIEASVQVLVDGELVQLPIDFAEDGFLTAFVLPVVGSYVVEVRALSADGAELVDLVAFEIVSVSDEPAEFPGLTIVQTFAGHFGTGADGIRDVNSDGVDDLLISSPGFDAGAAQTGRVELRSGATGEVLRTFDGEPGDGLGESVASLGDLNDDGFEDFAIGAPGASVTFSHAGAVIVISGADGTQLWRFEGEAQDECLGDEVACVGDINDDGVPDIGAGARLADYNGLRSGRARVWSGADGSLLWQRDGSQAYVQLGVAMDAVGDADGDGVDDFAVGIWGAVDNGGSSGAAVIVSGATGEDITRISGPQADDHFGVSLSALGDVNGDGVPDIVIGGIFGSPGGIDEAGYVQVHSCGDGALIRRLDGDQKLMRLGAAVDRAPDLDGDGVSEMLLGAPFFDGVRGAVDLVSGASGVRLMRIEGPPTLGLFGSLVRGLGDLNKDGVGDFLIAAPLEIVDGEFSGSARIFGILPKSEPALPGEELLRQPWLGTVTR